MEVCQGSKKTTSLIKRHELNQIFSENLPFLSIENYRHYPNFSDIKQRIYQSEQSSYTYENNLVSHIGNSSYFIDDEPERFHRYYDNVEHNISALKKIFSPYRDPIAELIMDLQAVWEPGVEIAAFHGKKMFAGIIRIIHKDSMIHAHQDFLAWSNPKALHVDSILGQFGMNFFIEAPKEGGGLMMWKRQMSKEEFNEAAQGDFCIPVRKLPPPDWRLKSQRGLLTLINTHYLHAIEPSLGDNRVAVSCFIGYQGECKPLLLWS